MTALNALRPAVGALFRNPILVALVGLFGLLQLPQFALQPSQPLLAAAVSLGMTGVLLVVMPFFQGGLLGMADEALGGRTGLGTLVAEGKANYVRLLIAYLAVFAVNAVLGFVVVFAVILGVASQYTGDGGTNVVLLGIAAVLGLLFALAYFLVAFFIQFYAHAIVLSDTGLVAGFKHSVGLVRRNLVSVFGYTLVLLAGSLLFGGVGGIASMLLSPQPTGSPLPLPDLSLPLLIGAAIVYVGTLAILGAFYATYSVAFYRSLDRRSW
ncbi:putative membrane protein [Halalkaliarchaeum sp. AArc-CO]|uniref:DUF7847 domain-containing protein n=1 Tax=Halalkaliarchaeum sp. AArc-CO TaxID=2866381 RepID=UPI00217D0389|nr:hypothetical protein [Halalkaliarchaeum sp. AArc-CO]UWG51971.1 putative membrane protein [Halalkaliarchaeum sp. AArc-CO]